MQGSLVSPNTIYSGRESIRVVSLSFGSLDRVSCQSSLRTHLGVLARPNTIYLVVAIVEVLAPGWVGAARLGPAMAA
jgi:hypothetical protein